jgi:hypothetical protein
MYLVTPAQRGAWRPLWTAAGTPDWSVQLSHAPTAHPLVFPHLSQARRRRPWPVWHASHASPLPMSLQLSVQSCPCRMLRYQAMPHELLQLARFPLTVALHPLLLRCTVCPLRQAVRMRLLLMQTLLVRLPLFILLHAPCVSSCLLPWSLPPALGSLTMLYYVCARAYSPVPGSMGGLLARSARLQRVRGSWQRHWVATVRVKSVTS